MRKIIGQAEANYISHEQQIAHMRTLCKMIFIHSKCVYHL